MIDPKIAHNTLPYLPPEDFSYDDKDILVSLGNAKEALAELKGKSFVFNENFSNLLLLPLTTKEAVESSNIENIHSTLEGTFEAEILAGTNIALENKESKSYKDALLKGLRLLKENGLKINRAIIEDVQKTILLDESLVPGFRKPRVSPAGNEGVLKIKNHSTGETLYTPPHGEEFLNPLISNFIEFYNDESPAIDPLIKISLLHYQFEAIHPFEDGNGRVGRIFLVLSFLTYKKLHIPIIYISKYLLRNKSDYMRLLGEVTFKNNWKEYIIFMLQGIESQAKETAQVFENVKTFIDKYESLRREHSLPLESSFIISQPVYTTDYLIQKGVVKTKHTAAKYLKQLVYLGFLSEMRLGREKYYYSQEFITILSNR
jgi:Fic family protein